MLQRLYAHNFRCFENFEFNIQSEPSSLLIGRNGSGKSTLSSVLIIFQQIGRGTSRVNALVTPRDFSGGRSNVPLRIELTVSLDGKSYHYELALELPEGFKELRVLDESLKVDGVFLYQRKQADVTLTNRTKSKSEAQFRVDWHQVALPLIQERTDKDPLHLFRKWLGQMVILSPQPGRMTGESNDETLQPVVDASNFSNWLTGLLGQFPSAYSTIENYLRGPLPDLHEFRNEVVGSESKRLLVSFAQESKTIALRFDDLSDGEKCFFLCATILAANRAYGPLFCFWDEPDNYLSLHEVGHFIVTLRRAFQSRGQIVMTSHNEEAILKFSADNTWVIDRKNHLEPSQTRTLGQIRSDLKFEGDLIQALVSGELRL
jgi:ABC-type cobalamin/Fe3+-siderophores transport system ATPase subunit